MYHNAFSFLAATSFLGAAAAHPLQTRQSSLQWGLCEFDFNTTASAECSTLDVPLDWTKEGSSEPLALELLRIKATEEPFLGSVLFNPGGPSALGTRHVALEHTSINRVLEGHYDLVGFDIRGTGRTIPFRCNTPALVESNTKRDMNLPQRNMVDYLENEGWHEAQMFADQCYEDNKDNGSYISTAFIARDMLAIVNALEEDGLLRFWGASWGSILGQTFASMFPEKVDRMFLESVMDPDDYMSGFWTHNMLDTDESLDNFLSECLAAPELCALANSTESATIDSIRSALSDVLNDLYSTQETVEVGYHALSWYTALTPATRYEDLKNRIFNGLYYVSRFPELDSVLTAAVTGNFSAIQPPDTSGDLDRQGMMVAAGAHSLHGISCLDGTVRATVAKEFYSYVEEQQASSELADGYMPLLWACPAWRIEPAERYNGPFSAKLTSPILFANGLADPITPMARARKVHEAWEGSGLLIHGGHGHGVDNQPSRCTDRVIRAYFINDILPEEGTKCEPDTPAFQWAYEQLSRD